MGKLKAVECCVTERFPKIYRTVVRPVLACRAETLSTKRQETRLEVNEMRMLR